MPDVMDAPVGVDEKAHSLQEDQSQGRGARAGFWRMVVASVRRQRAHKRHDTPASGAGLLHPMEMPLERLARENPMLFLQVNTGL